MTVSPPESTPNTPSAGSSLEYLHKMSRTAGLGSTDYVAVNTIAVATLILGFLSGLSLLGTAMLILPVATLVVGTIAIVQIRRSAGTQSGIVIAVLGMLIALGFAAMVGGKELVRQRKEAVEQKQIEALIVKFGQAVASRDYHTAWNCFDDKVQSRSSEAAYSDLWERVQGSPMYGKVKEMHSNGIVEVLEPSETGQVQARGIVIISRADGPDDRRDGVFVKGDDGQWLFEGVQGFEPPPLVKSPALQPR